MSMASAGTSALGKVAPAAGRNQAASNDKPGLGGLLRGPTVFGIAIVVLFFGLFGVWAAMAPLSSGAIASGVVSPDSANPAVQHLEGGIIEAIHVRTGEQVKAGQLLMTLQATRAQAGLTAQQQQMLRLQIVNARVNALLQGLDSMPVPAELADYPSAELDEFVASQKSLFESRRILFAQQNEIFERQKEQFGSEIDALRAQNDGLTQQVLLIGLELIDKQRLLDQQLIQRSEVLELQRLQAAHSSTVAANEANIARAGQRIQEIELAMLQEAEAFRREVASEGTDVNNQIAQLKQELVASSDQVARNDVRSPVDGVVLNMRHERAGGVVAPGETIMDIVPLNEGMVMLVRLAPNDIDSVAVGLTAHVTLAPFANRNALPLNGEVIQVAADSTVDERSGMAFYEVRVQVSPEEIARHDGMYLSPGMPADVTIVTGERTMLQYLLEPFLRSVRNAFVYD
jgi:HlyD family type I secretion membrane fusion protein